MSGETARLQAHGVALGRRLVPTDLDLADGSLTVLVGPNGAGKTSLLHALARIGRPSGSVRIDGRPIEHIPASLRPGIVGYVPATRDLAWPISVHDFVRLTAPAAVLGEVAGMLASLALTDFAERRVNTLSTGERSRVLLARALLPKPAVLLLDEPFANLDPLWQLRLKARLLAEAEGGMAILVSAHDLDLAARLSARMLVVDGGRVVADAAPELLIANGTIARIFGVERAADGAWCPVI